LKKLMIIAFSWSFQPLQIKWAITAMKLSCCWEVQL
jgi:hypothetical protein